VSRHPVAGPAVLITFQPVIKAGFTSLSSHEDLANARKFFEDKDISKFRLPVLQTFDAMQAAADWLSRDKQDVEEVRFSFFVRGKGKKC
jgi:hypothetical protein